MAANTPKLLRQQDQIDLTADENYTDPNNGVLYDLKTSRNFDSCTITFFAQDKFNQLNNLLKKRYTFSQNAKNRSLSTSFDADGQKVTLTLYTTRKLLIQGTGSWTWRNTAFRELSKCLSKANAEDSCVKGTSTPTAKKEELQTIPNSIKCMNSQTPSINDDIQDYDDKHNGSLYDIAPSKNGECYTAIFYTDQTFKEITELLGQEYTFLPNKTNSGNEANFLLYDKEVVVTLDKNKKMLIQGAGCKLWRNSVYRMLTDKLTPRQSLSIKTEPSLDESTDDIVFWHSDTPVKHPPTGWVKNTLNKTINKVRSPAASIKPKNQNETVQIPDEVDEATTPKITPEASSENQDKLQTYQSHLEKQMRENKQLQDSLKEIMCQSKLLKSENDKLQKTVVDLKSENGTLKSKLSGCDEREKENQQQIKTLKSRLAKESGENLIVAEENNKLKKKVDVVIKEKEKLLDQLLKCSTSTDSVENKIESELQDFKDIVIEELREIKSKIESSRAIQNNRSTSDIESSQPLQVITNNGTSKQNTTEPTPRNRDEPRQSSNITINEHSNMRKTAFIAGDSITSILSTKMMSDQKLKVNVKTHSGGRVRTVENSLIKMAEDESSAIRQAQTVVLHVGTNNVSDADQPEWIADEMKDLANTIHNINKDVKIIVSSILPRRNDKLLNRVIGKTNQSLKNACEEKGYYFLDNTESFMKDNQPNSALYKDNLHLNPKGGRTLGENIRQKIQLVLNIQVDEADVNNSNRGQQEQNFQKGRQQGRRLFMNNRGMMYMPVPMFHPPWFNGQHLVHFNNSQMNQGYQNQHQRY